MATMTASWEMTPTVIASTQRRLNVRQSCAPMASSDVAASQSQSALCGVLQVQRANGSVTKNPRRQKLV